jgi:hypothetical protein
MVLPSIYGGQYVPGVESADLSSNEFVIIDGYSRNLVLEEKLERAEREARNEAQNFANAHEGFHPNRYPVPSWYEHVALDLTQDPSDPGEGYGYGITTHQQALDYIRLSQRYYKALIDRLNYKCNNYPGGRSYCQHAQNFGGYVAQIGNLIPIIQNRITGIPSSYIGDPSVLQSDEQITLPSIYGGQYVPGVEPKPITTDHVPPPDMPVEEPPMVTVTPTEPGQVNWIPEPFFSFINNVFRK